MLKSYYEILGVESNATVEEIRKAFRKKIREFHPDLNPSAAKAQKRSRELNIAMEVLTDPEKRELYDQKIRRMSKAQANEEFESAKESPEKHSSNQNSDFHANAKANSHNSRSNRPIVGKSLMIWGCSIGIFTVCALIFGLQIFHHFEKSEGNQERTNLKAENVVLQNNLAILNNEVDRVQRETKLLTRQLKVLADERGSLQAKTIASEKKFQVGAMQKEKLLTEIILRDNKLESLSKEIAEREETRRLFDCSMHSLIELKYQITYPEKPPAFWTFKSDGSIQIEQPAGNVVRINSIWRPIDVTRVLAFHDPEGYVDVISVSPDGQEIVLSAISKDGHAKPIFRVRGQLDK